MGLTKAKANVELRLNFVQQFPTLEFISQVWKIEINRKTIDNIYVSAKWISYRCSVR